MNEEEYRTWRMTLDQWLEGRSGMAIEAGKAGMKTALSKNIFDLLVRARLVVEGINATAATIEVADLNKYDFLASRLETLLTFDDFSLAEYTFHLPGGRTPGVRLMFEKGGDGGRVTVIMFEDVVQWRVDEQGRKVSAEILYLDLGGRSPEAISPPGAEDRYAGLSGWRDLLTESLCLPVLIHGRA